MKVFFTKPNAPYSGGIVLVAANSEQEALLTASKDKECGYSFSNYNYESGEDIPSYDTYYEWSKFEEIPGLEYDTCEPIVIVSDYYSE